MSPFGSFFRSLGSGSVEAISASESWHRGTRSFLHSLRGGSVDDPLTPGKNLLRWAHGRELESKAGNRRLAAGILSVPDGDRAAVEFLLACGGVAEIGAVGWTNAGRCHAGNAGVRRADALRVCGRGLTLGTIPRSAKNGQDLSAVEAGGYAARGFDRFGCLWHTGRDDCSAALCHRYARGNLFRDLVELFEEI